MKKHSALNILTYLIILLMICTISNSAQSRYDRKSYYDKSLKNKPEPQSLQRKDFYNEYSTEHKKPKCSDYTKNEDFRNKKIEKTKSYNDYSYNKNNNWDTKRTSNYFHIDKKSNTLWNGKHWDFDDFPLKVYINKGKSKYLKQIHIDYVDYAFRVWQKADNRIKYNFVNSKSESDIEIIFVENLMEKYEENYLGLTDYKLGRNKKIEHSTIQISLLKFDNERVTDGEIKATIIHEIGHAFGLGHSDNEDDLMYPYISDNHTSEMDYNELTSGDKDAVRCTINLGESYTYNDK